MNKINIRGLQIYACHGVLPQEKIKRQPFIFDVEMEYDFQKAADSDDLSYTLDYGAVMCDIDKLCRENTFDLIETLCAKCAKFIMINYPAKSVEVKVSKPQAPVDLQFENVSVTVKLERREVLLSLGSNLGNRQTILDNAIDRLSSHPCINVEKISSPMENPPYGGVAKYPFINMAVKIATFLSPSALLQTIHEIESDAKRTRNVRWGDRTLDIDVIFYGDSIISNDELTVPHSDYHNRDFVLKPLCEIAPNFVCPLRKKRLSELLEDLKSKNEFK